MYSIKHYLVINSDVISIYKAITDEKGLKSWWTDNTKATQKIGDIIEFNFGPNDKNKMKILNLEPYKLVEWKCIEGDKEWIGTKFKFHLQPKNDSTILRFSHYDWKKDTDFFASCNYHWGYYMSSIKSYCENGEGTPFKNG